MLDDLEQQIKERLLEDLITRMSDAGGDRLKPKDMAVQVAAPDKDKLAEGLDKAKGVLDELPEGKEEASASSSSEEDDEERLMELLDEEDEEEGRK